MGRGVMRLAALFAALAGAAEAGCRLALVLALDVSGSVDAAEYRRQVDGVAAALESPPVVAALLSEPGRPVSLTVFEWSASRHQRSLLPWTPLTDRAAIGRAATGLRTVAREPAPRRTGLGGALEAGAERFVGGPACDRQVIDVSGDGRNNDWPEPGLVLAREAFEAITVNGLVVLPGGDGADPDGLADYFRAEVLHGPEAFLETARGFSDYERAMTRKLLREIEAPRIGRAEPDRATRWR